MIKTLLTGGSAVTALQILNTADVTNSINLISTLIITFVSLWKLFKNRKDGL